MSPRLDTRANRVDVVATAPAARLRELADLPAPRGWPIVGNALQVDLPRIHQAVERWCDAFGPFFRFRLGATELVAIADHEALAQVLRDRPDGFRRSPRTSAVVAEMGLDGPGVFLAEGDAWQRQRRIVMAAFSPANVRAYLPSLRRVAQRLEARWHKAAAAGAAIDLQADLMRFTVDTIAGLAFGTDIDTLSSDEEVIQQHLDKIFPAIFRRNLALFPYWRHVKLPADRRLDRSIAALRSATAGFIADARTRLDADPGRRERPANLLEAMIVAADAEASGVTDSDVAANMLTMLLAGEDTTANSIAWMIHLLALHPASLERARDEVRRLTGPLDAIDTDQLDSLDFLEACTHETMRLKPVAPFMVLQALRDTVVADVRIPAKTLIWGVMRHDSVDDRHVPDAAAFRPERWQGGATAGASSAGASSSKRVAMPFGAGPRVCPGRYLALLEIKLAMVVLLGRFDIESVTTPHGGPAEERMAFTMAPVGLRMRLKDRV